MKDYNYIILWADYFNSNFKRSEGRRIPLSLSIKDPKLEELEKAAKLISNDVKIFSAYYPKRHLVSSGFVSIKKTKPKSKVLKEMSKALNNIRSR